MAILDYRIFFSVAQHIIFTVYFEITLSYFNVADLIPKALVQSGNWQTSWNIYRRKLKISTPSLSDVAFSMNEKCLKWAAVMDKEKK